MKSADKSVQANRRPAAPFRAGRECGCTLYASHRSSQHARSTRSFGTMIGSLSSSLPLVAAILAVSASSGCQHRLGVSCPIDSRVVLRDCNVTDVGHPEVIAWTFDLGQAVVTGQRGVKHVLVVANRDPKSKTTGWSLASVSIMRSDGSDSWILGDREYDHPPTRDDISTFLKQLWTAPEGFVFKAGAR
jgi:hypothetical protein